MINRNDNGLPMGGRGETTRLLLLESLLRRPNQSRAQLGETLGVARATITSLLGELERAGMVEQRVVDLTDPGRRTIGRPPQQVTLRPGAAYAVGLDFGHRHIRAALCDLGGNVVADRWSEAAVDTDPQGSLDLAQVLTRAVLTESGVARGHVIGLGAGLAAPVNLVGGSIELNGMLPAWNGLNLAEELEHRLGLPTRVDNDANVGAMGEHLFGVGRGVADMVYLRLSAGVGLGLVLNGQIYRGAIGVAGEIGHIAVHGGDLICRCGNRGCLETVASPVAVADLLARSRGEAVSVTQLMTLVRANDRGACRAVADAGEAVGAAIASTVNLLNPDLVVIGGELAAAGELLVAPIRRAIGMGAVAPAANHVRVAVSSMADRAEVLGAAGIQLARAPQALARRLAAAA
ncbi:MAG TPA: ROK family protein [Solirubrobacter sp.]